ncbi:LysR substrate-binding domain-containing protein [Sphingomonas sp. MMS24-J13]|uniref:LysR substrate-binding domain-containing protein n=1 Tax=Sphingomonas sp. MMS24-J13 TaxID=3238686 RepID=UPI00384AD25D
MSFTGGAQALTVTQSAVSRHIGSLEGLIGKPLFERDPAGLKLTTAGKTLLPVVSKSLDRMEYALNGIREDGIESRPLRLHIPPTLLYQSAMPLLRDFHREHPDIRIDVVTSNATGEPRTDVDMAIVFDRPKVDEKVADLLRLVRVAPLCSPATAAAAEGRSLEQFLRENDLLHVRLEGEPRGLLWTAYADQQRLDLDTSRGMAFDTSITAVRYAQVATGVVLADIDIFAQEIAAGRLVMPYDRASADGFGYYLKTNVEDLADPAIVLLRDWIIRHFHHQRIDEPLSGE